MTVASVITDLENLVGFSYLWTNGGTPDTLHYWLTADKIGPTPHMVMGGMQCFGLPIRVALNNRSLSWTAASKMYSDFLIQCGTGQTPTAICPNGVTRFYYGMFCCVPLRIFNGVAGFSRGDVVFFSASNINYNAHVAVATGNGTEMVSFGHGATGLPASMKVDLLDMDEIVAAFQNQLTACYYGTPAW